VTPTRPRAADLAIGALLAVVYVAWLVATCKDLGFARDEGFYFNAADRYVSWLGRLADDPGEALRRPVVEAAWKVNHEHPSLMKTLFGLSNRLLEERADLFDEPSTSYRFPTMLLAGLGLLVLYLFGTEAYGRVAGLAAAAAFALQPRTFYHAHLACFDHPVTVMILLVTWAYWRSIGTTHARTWAVVAGVLFGLGLETKINMLFVPATLLVHYAIVWGRGRAARRFPFVPRAHLAMLLLGVPLFVGLWPWLWWETGPRVVAWLGFFGRHDYYTIEYLGVTYFRPPFPVSYAWGMLLFEVPATILLLVVAGVLVRGRAAWTAPDERRTDLLIAWSALVPILLISNGHSPIFGGSKHFMPAVPFLCLFAGAAAQTALARAAETLRGKGRALLVAAALALCAIPPFLETRRSHPFGLSHYGVLAGGTPGAADLGLCRQFWGFTTGSLTPFLNRVVSPRGAVQLHDTLYESYRMFQRDGRLRRDIRYASTAASAELALVHHEQHWAFLEYGLWDTYRTAVPRKVLTHQGVPIVTVYGPSRRAPLASAADPD